MDIDMIWYDIYRPSILGYGYRYNIWFWLGIWDMILYQNEKIFYHDWLHFRVIYLSVVISDDSNNDDTYKYDPYPKGTTYEYSMAPNFSKIKSTLYTVCTSKTNFVPPKILLLLIMYWFLCTVWRTVG